MNRKIDSESSTIDEFTEFDEEFEQSRREFAEVEVRSVGVMHEEFSESQAAAESSFTDLRQSAEEEFELKAMKGDRRFGREKARHQTARSAVTGQGERISDTEVNLENRLEDFPPLEVLGSLRNHLETKKLTK